MQSLFVKDIMKKNPVSVGPEDSLVSAAQILSEKGFNGLPVVDQSMRVIGIVTEYDLISRGGAVHLPTLINIVGNIDIYKKDNASVRDDLKKLLSIRVKDAMNIDPLTIRDEAPIQMLAETFAEHHRVNPIPVVDADKKLVGVVSRFDLVRFFANKTADQVSADGESPIDDRRVSQFINNLESKFVLVSRGRARFWPIVSVLFAVIGFVIAFAIIIRITVQN